ncbi:MAG TPA: 3',5'-cyclic-nucleotide phosphodiesterase [Puia sp.]|uniref:3',5'-cyclic-nucleotide phosphodiesterase n=1 Tax=Puia sp. TaxID=2045100 RepID=UPI002BD0C0EE|nr:3',5'-cyclic-nucleotide phosphodiesterase [Puia sp.]HVU94540.1 3',5'-cyclic-nucleotide phosphodiesterase [Puia sp.]
MNKVIAFSLFLTLFISQIGAANAQSPAEPAFTVIPLGVRGGLDESNLSAYLVAAKGSDDYISLDAGTLYAGLKKAVDNGLFRQPPGTVLRSRVKGYFISHPHLDHVAGLIINSPDDSAKNIYGFPTCLATLQDKYFSWKSWANFGDEGEKPQLKKYHYVTLEPGREIAADNTPLFVQAFPLSHGKPFESSAFLVRSNTQYLLYLGDTGADSVENATNLHALWTAAAPLIKEGALHAIFIEVSFPNEQPIKSLFGHLTPALLQQEMTALANLTGPQALDKVSIVITHRKPVGNQEEAIRRQLLANNPLHLKLIFPQQARRLEF